MPEGEGRGLESTIPALLHPDRSSPCPKPLHLAEVEVDTDTGRTRVISHLVVQDVGRAINPAAIEGQIQGAVAIGARLTELPITGEALRRALAS
ncbi:MAG TPA: molybdopterin cofactor-binding domain-containing protein [Pseudomonadales bacterium]|nr:molybdopterin cofactor-binding domain-containing protein [Pseudomonadales bacterium]